MSEATVKAAARYEQTDDGRVIIDVTAIDADDLHHRRDRSVPIAKRDFEPEIVKFLHEGAREIGKLPFVLRFRFREMPSAADRNEIRKGVKVYFDHVSKLEVQGGLQIVWKSVVLLASGLVFLGAALLVRHPSEEELSLGRQFLVQSLMVVAWMSIWESLATFILEWPAVNKERKLYRKLSEAEILFAEAKNDGPARSG